jgi:hypothetical protein
MHSKPSTLSIPEALVTSWLVASLTPTSQHTATQPAAMARGVLKISGSVILAEINLLSSVRKELIAKAGSGFSFYALFSSHPWDRITRQ